MLDTVTLTNKSRLYYDLTAFQQPTRRYRLVATTAPRSSARPGLFAISPSPDIETGCAGLS